MGVEVQQCAIRGFEIEPTLGSYEEYDPYTHHNVEGEGDILVYQEPRAHDFAVAGIVYFLQDSERWNGSQFIEPTALEGFDRERRVELLEAMAAADARPLHDEPKDIVFTLSW